MGEAKDSTIGDSNSRFSRVDHAYQEIKQRILNNVYYPGYQVLEKDLAEELGVSRTPVREALILLQHDGLVELIPRHGMRVVPIEADDMREIYEVLTALECLAAELLAKRRPDASELEPMRQAIVRMDQALEDDDLEAWARADENFHQHLLDLCGNRRLISMARTVMDQGHRARIVTLRLRPKPVDSNREHHALLDAIEKGDGDAARQRHQEHRRRASKVLIELLKKFRLPQL